jgi:uncharacterized Zn-finger protein
MNSSVILTKQSTVSCDGEPSPYGHPRIFIKLQNGEKAQCPYCSKTFVNTNDKK